MSEVKKSTNVSNPFITRIDAPKKSDFDKFYLDPEYKEVYRKVGVDEDGEEYGTVELKVIVKKRDIAEFINQDANNVGVAAYMRALELQGQPIGSFHTTVNQDVQDFSEMPDDKFEGMLQGDKALEIFKSLDPKLRKGHTTIAGFLNSLSKDTTENYIKGKVDAMFPKKEVKTEGGE